MGSRQLLQVANVLLPRLALSGLRNVLKHVILLLLFDRLDLASQVV